MDRYVIREPKMTVGPPLDQQIISFPPRNIPANQSSDGGMYYESRYGGQFPGMQLGARGQGFIGVVQTNVPSYPQVGMKMPVGASQTQIISGIDPSYLAGYPGGRNYYPVNPAEQSMRDKELMGFGSGYQNRTFTAPDRNKTTSAKNDSIYTMKPQEITNKPKESNATLTKIDLDAKPGEQTQILSKNDKLKALHKSGLRAFSGPVEKVLKWHKALQDIGVMVIYEVVAKCVNIRAGEAGSKQLLIRDDSGPAMQVIYYEIDFLLPELKPPCTVRIVGRMLSGTCRMQAFHIRPATGDDVTMLSRRAAVAAHHVAKLCKLFSVDVV